jgi:hypothetical protein
MKIVFPKSVRFELAILAAMALGSCEGPGLSQRQRSEVTEIAKDRTDILVSSKVSALDDRISAVETRLDISTRN